MITAAYLYFGLLALLTAGIIATEIRSRESEPKIRTVAAVAANCILANVYTLLTLDTDPWPYFMALDLMAASIILYQPAGRAQAVIGTLYLIQITMHAGYGIGIQRGEVDPVIYWWLLTGTGFLQLLFCGGWWIRDRWGRHFRYIRRQRGVAAAPYRTGVEKT